MDNESSTLEALFEKTETYVKSTLELAKLKTIDKVAEIVSSLLANLVVVILASVFFLIFNIGIALWLGELLGKAYYGFFVVSGFYAVFGLVIFIFKNSLIKTPISNSIISKALK
ncbi:MAG: phage holin family protein [Bacteroidia bacterium]